MTDRPGMFEVEPLSERRWDAIERGVLDRVEGEVRPSVAPRSWRPGPASRPTWAGRGIAAAAMLSLSLVGMALAWAVAHPEQLPPRIATSRVTTEDAPAHTSAGDVAVEVAARSSVLVIERAPDEWLVSIEHGSAHFRVPPRGARPVFAVEAGEVRVEVVGTRFEVAREAGTSRARVAVEEGTVRVTSRGEQVLVHAGDRWPTARAEAGATRTDGAPTDVTATDLSERGAPVAAPSVDAVTEPAPAAPETGARTIARVAPRYPAPGAAAERHLGSSDREVAGATDRAAPDEPPAPVLAPTPRERFARAAALEASAPDEALAAYEELERAGGAWAANALFARARLELERGHRDRARALLERYLAEHPDGLNAEDARDLLARTR